MADLPALMDTIIAVGAKQWQYPVDSGHGQRRGQRLFTAATLPVVDLMPLLARLYRQGVDRGLVMIPGNNIGVSSAYEHLWRGLRR